MYASIYSYKDYVRRRFGTLRCTANCMRSATKTEANDPHTRVVQQSDDGLDDTVSVDEDARRSVAKLPYEPPVIETFHPMTDGLPPGVFHEWGGKCLIRQEQVRARGPRS
jgi:hypothetical protein